MTEIVNLITDKPNALTNIEKALRAKYEINNTFENCVIVLGYNEGEFDNFKACHPGKRILIYQLELIYSPESLWYNEAAKNPTTILRTKRIKEWLNGCDLILEYDFDNISFLMQKGYGDKTLHHPLEYSEANVHQLPTVEKKYDVLFYGAINEKRVALLNEVRNHFNVCIVGNFNPAETRELATFEIIDSKYGDDIWQYINESKVVLNLHYYPDSQEQARIYELLCNGVKVLSEHSNVNYFGDLIQEFETKEEMISKLGTMINDVFFSPETTQQRFKNKDFKTIESKVNFEKVVVAVVVYNRLTNLERWLHCWSMCDKSNAELVVIHNQDEGADRSKYIEACERYKVKYIARKNSGYDIGALKDVVNDKLPGFPDFDALFWVTDDNIPMSKDFLSLFIDKMKADVGVVCTEISQQITPHIRTSGFLISKSTLKKIKFPEIITKSDCYYFEHTGGENTFYHQILKENLRTVVVSELPTSPIWDIHSRPSLNRMQEHNDVFGKKVTFICPIYKSFPAIISSLILQTHKNWELLLIHDGPADDLVKNAVAGIKDHRIKFMQTEKRKGNWGHYIRQWALNEIRNSRLSNPDYIVITNADNYHVPVFCEYMIKGFVNGHVATYCGDMVHSYINWKIIPCKMELGGVDCAGVMVRKDVACDVGWRDIIGHSSDWTYFEDIMKKHGANKFAKVEGCLLIHN